MEDLLEFGGYCQALVDVIRQRQAEKPLTVGIIGESGMGKTTLMRLVERAFSEQDEVSFPVKAVWINAWKFRKERNPLGAFLLSLLERMRPSSSISGNKDAQAASEHNQVLNEKLSNLQKLLFELTYADGLGSLEIQLAQGERSSVKLSLPSVSHFSDLVDDLISQSPEHASGSDVAEIVVQDLVDSYKRQRIRRFIDEVEIVDRLQDKFSEIIKDLLPEDGRFVVFIDDLERCNPDKAVEILECTRVFRDLKRCTCIVAIDNSRTRRANELTLNESVRMNKNEGQHAAAYNCLEGMIHLPIHLTPSPAKTIKRFVKGSLGGEFNDTIVSLFTIGADPNPGKIKRLISMYRFLWSLAQHRGVVKSGEIRADLLAKIVVIQYCWPDTLYLDIIKYPDLLYSLEDHFDRDRDLARGNYRSMDSANGGDSSTESPQREFRHSTKFPAHLGGQYAQLEKLERILTAPHSGRFKDHGVVPYIDLSNATSAENNVESVGIQDSKPHDADLELKQDTELLQVAEDMELDVEQDTPQAFCGPDFAFDSRILESLMRHNPAHIESVIRKLNESEKKGYADRLLAVVLQNQNNLLGRVAAGNALGILGDPRAGEREMIVIPAGKFMMGSDDGDDTSPKHQVYLDTFEIAKYPVTNSQYKEFLDANPNYKIPDEWEARTYPLGKANHPVVNISRADVLVYIKWLNEKEGTTYRLPTEAEWEKAARGTTGREYPWGDEFDPQKCNTREARKIGLASNTIGADQLRKIDTTPIGIYADGKSTYGVMDMSGNVWEWCADWYAAEYYANAEERNPTGPKSGEVCVVRGGSWRNDYDHARCVSRHWNGPDYWFDHVGARLCRIP